VFLPPYFAHHAPEEREVPSALLKERKGDKVDYHEAREEREGWIVTMCPIRGSPCHSGPSMKLYRGIKTELLQNFILNTGQSSVVRVVQ